MQPTAKDITKSIHQAEAAIEGAPELVILPDGNCRLFTGGRMPAGATKGTFLGPLPKTLTAATGPTGLPRPARAVSGRRTAGARSRARSIRA